GVRHAARSRRGEARRRCARAPGSSRRDRAGGRSMSAHAVDQYVDFCEGFRRLTGIDLSQYKRTQMERRIRSFASGRGLPELARYLRLIADDATELQAFLARVTINVSPVWRNQQVREPPAKRRPPERPT